MKSLTVHSETKQTPLPPFEKASGAAEAWEEVLTVAAPILCHSQISVGHSHPLLAVGCDLKSRKYKQTNFNLKQS